MTIGVIEPSSMFLYHPWKPFPLAFSVFSHLCLLYSSLGICMYLCLYLCLFFFFCRYDHTSYKNNLWGHSLFGLWFQNVQSTVAWPHALEQNNMVVRVCGRQPFTSWLIRSHQTRQEVAQDKLTKTWLTDLLYPVGPQLLKFP